MSESNSYSLVISSFCIMNLNFSKTNFLHLSSYLYQILYIIFDALLVHCRSISATWMSRILGALNLAHCWPHKVILLNGILPLTVSYFLLQFSHISAVRSVFRFLCCLFECCYCSVLFVGFGQLGLWIMFLILSLVRVLAWIEVPVPLW